MVPIKENFYIPIFGGIAYNSFTFERGSNDSTLNGLAFGLGIGMEYLVSNKIGARLYLTYNNGSLTEDESPIEWNITTVQAGVGVNFYFGRKA